MAISEKTAQQVYNFDLDVSLTDKSNVADSAEKLPISLRSVSVTPHVTNIKHQRPAY